MKLTFVPVLIASLLSLHGLRKKSLSPGGALAAFVVGLLMMAGGLKFFGISLNQLEDGYHEAGYRSGWQVISNSFAAFIACVLWNALFSPDSLQAALVSLLGPEFTQSLYGDGSWCPIDKDIAGGWSRACILAALGLADIFSCCLGDTLASELGVLSRSKPILITTFKPVPPGTNGGMSLGGTLASVVGGTIMGLTTGACLILESSKCRETWMPIVLTMTLFGAIGGGAGSLTKFSESKKLILQDESTPTGPIKVISGINILTNNQVNVVSSVFTSIWMSLL
ncbi:hypothetical protein BT96DRAFT_961594 [Gymnopus androsaceus JB14]|uniref:DUF92-domain-containing protein n=1 Tax=Gymnopus androsaceus JB14 TaxID=1447944 RepID=A0A6A4IK58_9AGAR|nr:hypothetical protein BT96DRAFT_961594 [Gymnopus androsaceus JB14]